MSATLLQITQDFCRVRGLGFPSVVTTSTDETILQILGILNEEVRELSERKRWGWLRRQAQFQHVNGLNYLAYDLSSLADYEGIVPATLWASDIRLPVAGPIPAAQWQQMVQLQFTAAQYNYRIYGGGVYIYPVPSDPSAVTFSFEYYSDYPVVSAAGVRQAQFLADTDSPVLPDRLIRAGLKWRWQSLKSMQYAEDFRTYEAMVLNEAGTEEAPTDIMLGGTDPDSRVVGPGLLIAAGNWNV